MSAREALTSRRAALSDSKRRLLQQRLEGRGRRAAPADSIPPREVGTPPVLSFAQEAFLFLHHLGGLSPAYHMHQLRRLRGTVDAAALGTALQQLVARHEALRTSFFLGADGARAQVHAQTPIALIDRDLRQLGSEQAQQAMRSESLALVRRPFDLETAPLLRAQLFCLGPSDYVVALVIHHLVCDEWSLAQLWQEWAECYGALLEGKSATLPELPIQYGDFSCWERRQLGDDRLASAWSYWKQTLAELPPALNLPTDHACCTQRSFAGHFRSRSVPATLAKRLREFNAAQGVTLFMTAMATFQVLLYRYSGQSDFCIGTPATVRGRAELRNVVGLLLNTLPIRARVDGSSSFLNHLKSVRDAALEAYGHAELPFAKLVEWLKPPRESGLSPLFRVMLVHQRRDTESADFAGIQYEPMTLDGGVAKFDLTLFVEDGGEELSLAAEFSNELFEIPTIDRLLGHFQRLLEAIVAEPSCPLDRLPLLTDSERRQVLVEWNDTERVVPSDRCIHQLIEQRAADKADATAVVQGSTRVSYAELMRLANGVARALLESGVKPGSPVPILARRSPQTVAAMLGVLKAGAAYVPLDADYPTAWVEGVLDDLTQAYGQRPVVLVEDSLRQRLPSEDAVVTLEASARKHPTSPDERTSWPSPEMETLAYVLYTSGSTGRPKGVAVTHRNLLHATIGRQLCYTGAPKSFLLLSSFSFDSSVAGLFWSLLEGAMLVLPGHRQEQDMAALCRLIAAHEVSHTLCLPSLYRLLLEHGDTQALGSMDTVIVAGEACPGGLGRAHHRALPNARLYNEYGPTEATVWCTFHQVAAESHEEPVPIGRPIPNAQVYILDRAAEPLPVGVPGELHIGGEGVARGYLGQPSLTAERFVETSFPEARGSRLYRSGDLARYRSDGVIEFLGRLDDQVKIRGQRIEPGEIEATLSDHPDVAEAAVVAERDQGAAGTRLVGYVVLRSEQSASPAAELREYLRRRLPEHMVPVRVVALPALPRTPSGKLDRKALPTPEPRPALSTPGPALAANPLQRELARLWAEVLGLEQVGIHDNFFEIGGDSILSIRIVARARERGIPIGPNQIFEHQTIAQLATVCGQQTIEAKPEQLAALVGEVPLTPIQRWFFDQRFEEPQHWNQALLLTCPGGLRLEPLRAAARALISRHDALRMRFRRVGEAWEQRCIPPDDAELPVDSIDLSVVDDEVRAEAVTAESARVQASLDLGRGPVARLAVFESGDGSPSTLLLVLHHLVVDGASWPVLIADLERAYDQATQGIPIALPPATTSLRRWGHALETLAASPALAHEAKFWLDSLTPAEASLPMDDSTVAAIGKAGEKQLIQRLEPEQTQLLLQQVPPVYGTRINDVLLTALARVLSDWCGRRRHLIDLEGHGREALAPDIDVSETVGWLTSMFPVVLTLPPNDHPGEAIKAIKEQLRRVPRNGLAYSVARYLAPNLALRAALEEQPQASVLFNYLGQFDQFLAESRCFARSKLSPGPMHSPRGHRHHVLEINAAVLQGELVVCWSFSPALHREQTIADLATDYLSALRRLIDHCLDPEAGGYTPSDFPDVDLGSDELDALIERYGGPQA